MATATVFSPLLHKFCYGGTSMAASGIFSFSPRSYSPATPRMGFLSLSVRQRRPSNSFQVRSVAAPSEAVSGFDDMVVGTQRKYYMLGGKGGVGKTSCAASLLVKFANNGHPTIVVSTDPAHSLSDSFAQDLTGGMLVPVEGPNAPLFALELGDLKLGQLLDTPPPGLDEAIAISKVMQFLESPQYSMFTRIVFDTVPMGHTLRLLSLPDFLDASIGKILKTDKLEILRERMVKVRELFWDNDSTEFIIVTIPMVMAISESSRLHASLKEENVPVRKLIVN